MKALNDVNLESGAYIMPTTDNRNVKLFDSEYQKECMKMHEAYKGKPVATIFYVKEGVNETPATVIKGYLYQFISVFCVALILAASSQKVNTFFNRWWLVMLVAVVLSVQGPLMGLNWMGLPWHYVKDMIADHIFGWGLCGAWLAWYFGRE